METTNTHIDDIKEMLSRLSEKRLQEVHDFISFLLEKEQKHKAFVERVLEAEKQPTEVYNSPEEYMQAIQRQIDEIED